MKNKDIVFSVFTKPWKNLSAGELGKLIHGFGFEGVELPVRPGFQVEPENAEKGLPQFAGELKGCGLKIMSVAANTDEKVFAGCAAAGIPLIRIMYKADLEKGYLASEAEMKKDIEKFIPLCREYCVKVGIQHHFGPMVSNSMEMLHLLKEYNPDYVGAIWDAAHSGLAGEEPEQGLDIVWSHLALVNLKNAFYKLKSGPEAEESIYERYFTTGKHGLCSWSRTAKYLKKRGYKGVICMPAEYTGEENVNSLIAKDIRYARSLFE